MILDSNSMNCLLHLFVYLSSNSTKKLVPVSSWLHIPSVQATSEPSLELVSLPSILEE